jgi:hypothetical protein
VITSVNNPVIKGVYTTKKSAFIIINSRTKELPFVRALPKRSNENAETGDVINDVIKSVASSKLSSNNDVTDLTYHESGVPRATRQHDPQLSVPHG